MLSSFRCWVHAGEVHRTGAPWERSWCRYAAAECGREPPCSSRHARWRACVTKRTNYIPMLRTGKLTWTLTYLVLATSGAPYMGPLGQRQASLVAYGGCSIAPPGPPVRCVPMGVPVPEAPWSRGLSRWEAMTKGGVER